MKFKPQLDEMDCGPACLAMISSNLSKNYNILFLFIKNNFSNLKYLN